MRRVLIAGLFGLSLVGCAGLGIESKAPVVTNDVAAAEIALTSAERMALVYLGLPRCLVSGGPVICSSQAVVDRIKALDQQAFDAVMAAKKNAGLISFAWSAISAFQSAIPTK